MRRFFARLGNLFRTRRAESEMAREIEAHLALLQEEFESMHYPCAWSIRCERILKDNGVPPVTQTPNPIVSFFPLAFLVIVCVPMAIAWIKIFSRVGWAPWLGVLMFIPPVNLVLMFVLGFKEWPIERRLKALGEARSGPPANI
jgi:hypothetical protein